MGLERNIAEYEIVKLKTNPVLQLTAQELGFDFAALALFDPKFSELRWCAAYGSLAERYASISIKVGSGIAGKVFRNNEIMHMTFDESVEHPKAYPIFGVERLRYAVAVPVGSGRQTIGVLLAGKRTDMHRAVKNKLNDLFLIAEQIHLLFSNVPKEEIVHRAYQLEQTPLFHFLSHGIQDYVLPLNVEILDQRIASLPEQSQEALVAWLRKMLQRLNTENSDLVQITIEKREDPYITMHILVRADIPFSDQETRLWLGELRQTGGTAQVIQQENQFDWLLRFPAALLR